MLLSLKLCRNRAYMYYNNVTFQENQNISNINSYNFIFITRIFTKFYIYTYLYISYLHQ